MRALLLVVLLAPATAAADREAEAWVGTWRGAATWKGCSVEGADELAVTVSWKDGFLWLDGDAIYDGLGALAPESRDGALVVETDDLTVALRAGKRGATLRLRTAAQCTMTAKLARDGSGIAACDGLVALATVATACGVAVDDDPADEVEGWRALRGKARTRAGARCRVRADALRPSVVAGECVPPDGDPGELASCRTVWRQAQRILRCERAPVELKNRTTESMAGLRRSLRGLAGKRDGADVAATLCDESAALYRDMADVLHCP